MASIKELLDEIYPRLDLSEALSELEPKDKGNYYELKCPFCKREGRAYIYKGGYYIKCNRGNKCGRGKSIWDYIQEKGSLSRRETLEELSRLAHYPLPSLGEETLARIEEAQKRESVLEETLAFCQGLLWEKAGAETLAYLTGRGYSEEEIRVMGFGHHPGKEALLRYLETKGYTREVMKGTKKDMGPLHWIEWRDAHKVIFAYRSPGGRIKAIYGRLTRPQKEVGCEDRKYLNFGSVKKDTLFGIHAARGEEELVVVEGFFDVMIAQARGMKNVVSCMTNEISEDQLEDAKKRGVKRILLALDNDQAGRKGTEQSLSGIMIAGLKGFVVSIPEGKDPDSIIVKEGIEAFMAKVKVALSWWNYKLNKILEKYNLSLDKEKSQAIEEILKMGRQIRNKIDYFTFLNKAAKILQLPPQALKIEIEKYKEKEALEKLERDYHALIMGTEELLKQRKLTDAKEYLEREAQDIGLMYEKEIAKPSLSLESFVLEKKKKDEERAPEGLLGYKLRRFGNMAMNLEGIQPGFYILGAETNVGKTALMANIFLDLIRSNPGLSGVYFSLDDNRAVIINRLLSIISGLKFNEVKRLSKEKEKREKREEAYCDLLGYVKEGFLDIKDQSEVIDSKGMERILREKARESESFFVVIDGLYNLESGGDIGDIRRENIERANMVKRISDNYSIPLIATGELRKKTVGQGENRKPTLSDLMETGKLAYNANLVWLLYPEKWENFKDEDKPILKLNYAKNKISECKKIQDLTFIKKNGRIEEGGD